MWAKFLSPSDLVKTSPKSDIRNLWSRATLSQPKLTNVYKDSAQEDSPESSKAGQRTHSEPTWEERDDRKKVNIMDIMNPQADGHTSEQSPSSFLRNDVEGVEDSGAKMGQCGFTTLWAVGVKRGEAVGSKFLGFPEWGTCANLSRLTNQAFLERPLLGRHQTGSCGQATPGPREAPRRQMLKGLASLGPCF